MDPKYSNIFYHQGVKVFEEKVLQSKQGQTKVAHLENDVTKALLNLFQHCSPKVLKTFLQMLNVGEAPQAFEFDFQITDTESYRQTPNRIMLSIISAGTQKKSSDSYYVVRSLPGRMGTVLRCCVSMEGKRVTSVLFAHLI